MCEDVCPVDIPVARIFKQVGEAAQAVFDYVPGKDPEEEIPIRTFVEDELHEVER
jgi:formate dehydrogenase subunit beta